MGKLNIAHHKSYHPYRADNIARVRKDEENARLQRTLEDDRALVADAEARMDMLRKRAGISDESPAPTPAPVSSAPTAETASAGKHINLFEDLEQHATSLAARASKSGPVSTDADRGVALAPTKKDLAPWYASKKGAYQPEGRDGWQLRDHARKSHADPLASIPARILSPSSSSRTPRPPPPPLDSSTPTDLVTSRLSRESSERARAQALIKRKHAERERALSEATPSTVHGGNSYASDMYNRAEVEAARRERERDRGGGRRAWDRDREDVRRRGWDEEEKTRRRW